MSVSDTIVIELEIKSERFTFRFSYTNQIHQEGRLEHPVQTHVLVNEKILQAAPGAVLGHDTKYTRVEEQSQEQIDVLVPHVSKLRGTHWKQQSYEPPGLCHGCNLQE